MTGYIFLAIFTGILIAASRAINSRLGIAFGSLSASFWNHIIGFLFLVLLFIIIAVDGSGFHAMIGANIPIFTYLGGFFGALFVTVNCYVFPRIGALKAILLVTGGQIVSSVLIGYKSISTASTLLEFCGVAIILLGIYLAKSSNVNHDESKNRLNVFLNDKSYHIEFNGHLTNHNKHAVVALNGLGASHEQIKSFYDNYAIRTPYGYGLEPAKISQQVITMDNWEHYLGKRIDFSSYYQFFEQEEKKLGMGKLLKRTVPVLLPGWVGSLTHGTIHLGWGLDVQNHCMTIEGLAYMAFSYVSCHPERISSKTKNDAVNRSALESLFYIADSLEKDPLSFKSWVETALTGNDYIASEDIHPELVRSGLQYRIAKMLAKGHPLIYDTSAWIDHENMSNIWEQLYYLVTLLYMEKPGDFLILHLVTSLHAMEKIVDYIPLKNQKYAMRCFWVGMLCILFSGGEFPKKTTLLSLNEKYMRAVDTNENGDEAWKQTITRAIGEEEEHNPKMVYVMQRIWKSFGYRSIFRIAANHFTTTPELPKSFETPPIE